MSTSTAQLDPSLLTIERTTKPGVLPPSSTLRFGQTFTDHMLTAKWTLEKGWEAPAIVPYGPLSLDPASTVLHYAPTLFEGMKVSQVCFVFGAKQNVDSHLAGLQRL